MKSKFLYIIKSIVLIVILCSGYHSNAQVGIGTTAPNGALDINSTTQGLVVPRVSLTGSNVASPIINPTGAPLLNGTLVYNTVTAGTSPNNVIPGFYFWDGSKWVLLNVEKSWSVNGNSGTTAGSDFIGTTDAKDLVTKTNNTERVRVTSSGNVGIGTSTPTETLDVAGNFKISGALMPNNDAGTEVKFLQSAGTNSPPEWKQNSFSEAEFTSMSIASGDSDTFTIGIRNDFVEYMRIIVTLRNACGFGAMDEYLMTGSNANNSWAIQQIAGIGGRQSTTTFTKINFKTIAVTRGNMPNCQDGSNSTGFNYTIKVDSGGKITITNNGNIGKTYNVRVITY